jgi:predicted nucleotidyltransferase
MKRTDPLAKVVAAFHRGGVRFIVMGVWGANYYAKSGATLFATQDQDLFLPLDPDNLLRAWQAGEAAGLSLWVGDEPLDLPRDLTLARAVVERRAMTTATGDEGLQIDLTLVMGKLEFDVVWERRRTFVVDDVEIPVARLADIVTSKANAGREKDRLFLATHAEALRNLIRQDDDPHG